jgi:uncharacterized protein (TIGR02246 family)
MRQPAGFTLIAIVIAGSLAMAGAESETAVPAAQQPQATDDFGKNYVAAYNKGDAKAVASFYAEDVDYTDQDGQETKGRDEMEKLLAAAFQANPGAKLEIAIDEVKQLTPDVVVSRGVATVTAASGIAEATRFVVTRVRKGDHWEISQLIETAAPAPSAFSQLQALQWLVGSWGRQDR